MESTTTYNRSLDDTIWYPTISAARSQSQVSQGYEDDVWGWRRHVSEGGEVGEVPHLHPAPWQVWLRWVHLGRFHDFMGWYKAHNKWRKKPVGIVYGIVHTKNIKIWYGFVKKWWSYLQVVARLMVEMIFSTTWFWCFLCPSIFRQTQLNPDQKDIGGMQSM